MAKTNTVCIIDDDPIFVYIAKRLMNETDFSNEIIVYENGKQGIDGLIQLDKDKKEIPCVIFLDLSMPIMSGWEFLDSLMEAPINNEEKIKIVVMSSSINPNEIERIKAYPIVADYIVKPITPSDLERIISL